MFNQCLKEIAQNSVFVGLKVLNLVRNVECYYISAVSIFSSLI